MTRRSLAAAAAAVALGLLVVPAGVAAPTPANPTASAAVVAEALPHQCVVPHLRKLREADASALLIALGCKVHLVSRASTIRSGLVIGARGGVRSYRYHHLVTVFVSSGRPKV